MATMDPRRWVRAVAIFLTVALVGSVVVAVATVGGDDASTAPIANGLGPSEKDLEVLAAELSSGDRNRILRSLADIPVESADDALAALGSLQGVTFDPSTLRYDEPTKAALVDASLTATDGSVRDERVVLVERDGRWLIYTTLQQPGATPIQTP